MFLVSLVIGFLIVIGSVFLIRRELIRGINIQNSIFNQVNENQPEAIIELLDQLKSTIDEMNRSFYDIANDLDGKFSVHEKQISDLEIALKDLKALQNDKEVLRKPFSHVIDASSEVKEKSHIKEDVVVEELDLLSKARKMLDDGYDLKIVAKKLEIGYGELKLMLNIKK